jgi:hypothetical protein
MNTSLDDHSSLSDSLPTSVRALEGIDARKALGLILAVSAACFVVFGMAHLFQSSGSSAGGLGV